MRLASFGVRLYRDGGGVVRRMGQSAWICRCRDNFESAYARLGGRRSSVVRLSPLSYCEDRCVVDLTSPVPASYNAVFWSGFMRPLAVG
jgi:hypothetical protein